MEVSIHNSAGNSYTAAQSREADRTNQPGLVHEIIDLSREIFPAIMGDIASKGLEIVGRSVASAVDDIMTEQQDAQAEQVDAHAAAIDLAAVTIPALAENLMPAATGSRNGYENIPSPTEVLATVAGNFAAATGADINNRTTAAQDEPNLDTAA